MRRSYFVAGTAVALVGSAVFARAQLLPVIPDDWSAIDDALIHGTITPPGAEITEKIKELSAYDELVYGYPSLTESQITTTYFKDGAFRPVTDVKRTYYPRSDVKIVRDAKWGVPHIYGLTDRAAAYGAGFAAAEDRLPIIMALNALGRAEAFELLGDNASWLADAEMVRLYGYTDAEFQAMIDRLPVVYGQDGQDIKDMLGDLTAGMNAALLQMQLGLLPLPPGVTELGGLPAPFRPTDIVSIVSIVRALFGAGGGGELANAEHLLSLVDQYGPERGMKIYEDFRNRFSHDGIVHTTHSFPYGAVPAVIDPASSPYPVPFGGGDPGAQVFFQRLLAMFPGGMAQASAQTASLAEQSRIKYENLVLDTPGGRIDLSHPGHLSNHVVIDGTISTSGHPILLGGPQAGYFDPQILVENELHGDRIHARGAGFPGMGFVVIGRNANAAWTPTAGGSDMIDLYIEELCEPGGGAATEDSLHYRYNGSCVAMDRRVHRTLDAAPIDLPGRELLPEIIVERTVHGPVVARGKIGDKPVAVSRKRSTYMKELDAAICILRLNRNQVPNGESFVREFTKSMNLSTNWTYADASEIAYVHGGLYPVRPPGAHPDLPVWGTGGYEWQRDPGLAHTARIKDPATDNDDVYLSDLAGPGELSKHPHEVRPERHYIVSWNNRPAPDWASADSNWGWSSLYRADLLEDLVRNEIVAGRKISPTRLVQIMEHAGLSDLRGTHVLPDALAILGHATAIGPNAAHRIAVLQAWAAGWTDFANARGPLRRDGDRDGAYDQAEAIGIMDAWWDPMIHAIFDPGLGGRDVTTVSVLGTHNAPGPTGSAFQDGFYGQVHADLARVLGEPLESPTSQIYCGSPGVGVDGDLVSCANALAASLEAISPSDANALSERIRFLPTAALSMHWVNRPTTQGLAMFPEPSRGLLLGAGALLVAALARRRARPDA
jgi:acyl-homoserine lactone acylase PvdQ